MNKVSAEREKGHHHRLTAIQHKSVSGHVGGIRYNSHPPRLLRPRKTTGRGKGEGWGQVSEGSKYFFCIF